MLWEKVGTMVQWNHHPYELMVMPRVCLFSPFPLSLKASISKTTFIRGTWSTKSHLVDVLPLKWFFCVHQWLRYSNLVIWASNRCRFTTFLRKSCFALYQWVTKSEADKDEILATCTIQRGKTTLSDLYTPWISSVVWGLVFALNPVVQQWRFFSHTSVWNAMSLTLWPHRLIYTKSKT